MEKILDTEIEGKRVFLKRTKKGFRIVYPYKIDDKINWKNVIAGGSWFNLIKVVIIVGLILGCVWEYSKAVNIANQCLNTNPFFSLN